MNHRRLLYSNPALPGFWIAADVDAERPVIWPDEPEGWSKRRRYFHNGIPLREVDACFAYGTGWPGAPRLGKKPRAGEKASNFTLRLTPAERARFAELAGDQPLGDWIREKLAAAAGAIEYARGNSGRFARPRAGSQRGQATQGEGVASEAHAPAPLELDANAP